MNEILMEQLLNEAESESLDFKVAQYQFVGGSIGDRAELLKDVLAFSNSWRRVDAYILIGVREIKGGRSQVEGIPASEHLEDASLQQFVNSKTQGPLAFAYRAFAFEGKQLGVLHIPLQDRPFYLKDRFGALEKNVVYIRRGSSTSEALPDEVIKMGRFKPEIVPALPAPDPTKLRLEEALASRETVVVIEWIEGRGVLAMRSTPVECTVVKVTDNYAKFQPPSGGTISRPFRLIALSENAWGVLQADLE